jgi:rhodanese-related sulfurtransferase
MERTVMTQTHTKKQIGIVTVLSFLGGLMPWLCYSVFMGQVNQNTPQQAKRSLSEQGSQALLVDVRSKADYDTDHIQGALHWPKHDILACASVKDLPDKLGNKTLFLYGKTGLESHAPTKHLTKNNIAKAINIRGGIQDWIGSVSSLQAEGSYENFQDATGKIHTFPTRISPFFEQSLAVISGYVIKPTYTGLALLVAIVLWRRRETDLTALRWGMLFFFLGENCCTINYLVFRETSYLFEYLHSYGMLLAFGFTTYAVIEGLDHRLLKLSSPDKHCVALPLCQQCVKYTNVPCGLKRVFSFMIPAAAALAFMPLCADWYLNSYNTMIFGTQYHYSHAMIYQIFERIYCPVAAIGLLTASWLTLLRDKDKAMVRAKVFFSAGVATLGFGLLRTLINAFYDGNRVWCNFWEEGSEFLFVAGVCIVFWIFRASLMPRQR